ncbi:hypothetical protein ABWH96_11550 [Marivirga tractuosa]|uniref:hypothetical protein n=1 Tax=Marivirga tractuosa TaxID=1006 RepID=UPI0035D0F2A0
MKLGIKTLAIAVIFSTAIACQSDKKEKEETTASERTEEVKQDFGKKKSEWEAKLKSEIDKLEKRIEKAEADSDLEKDLKEAQSKLERNLSKIEDSTEDTWVNVKKDVKNAYDDVKNEIEALGEKIENELD